MAFISSCPKCQKPVLVPEGHGHDAVVQCPACSERYSLGEILASVPMLIVVQPGSAALATEGHLAQSGSSEAAAPVAIGENSQGMPEPILGGELVGSVRYEPSLQNADAIDFFADEAKGATPNGDEVAFAQDAEHAAPDALFAAALAEEAVGDQPSGQPLEQAVFPESVEGQEPSPEAAENWVGDWVGSGDEASPAHGDNEMLELTESDVAAKDSMEGVDFAAITGKPAPGTASSDSAATPEPPKKKKRTRKLSPIRLLIGVTVSALLALGCVLGFVVWSGTPLEIFGFKFNIKNANQNNLRKSATPTNTIVASADKPADNNPAVPQLGNNAPAPTAGEPAKSGTDASAEAPTAGGAAPNANPNGAAKSEPSADTTFAPLAVEPKKETAGSGQPTTPGKDDRGMPGDAVLAGSGSESQPPAPQGGKIDLETPAVVAPVPVKPKNGSESSPEATAKPAIPSKSDEADPFATGPDKPGLEKPKTEPKIEAPTAVKPDSPPKPETPLAPPTNTKPDEADPFAAPQEKPAPEKPAIEKPISEPKPELPAKPEISSKPEVSGPIAPPPEVVPEKEKPKSEPTPSLPAAAKPDATAPELPAPVKPDAPVPEKPDVFKPEVAKPEPKVEVKPAGAGPIGAPSYAAADLDKSVARVAGAIPGAADWLKGDVYREWCQLAETATFFQDATAAEKQAAQDAVKKLANPQSVTGLAASAKKLLDDKTTKGGIVLAGKVSGIGSKNGLFGTAIRMEGMPSPVMVFSAHPLDVKESQTVVVPGALVSEPAKNLPGYTGKLPIVVWADFAVAVP